MKKQKKVIHFWKLILKNSSIFYKCKKRIWKKIIIKINDLIKLNLL